MFPQLPVGEKDYLSFQDNSAHYSGPIQLAAKLHKPHNSTSAKKQNTGCRPNAVINRTQYIHVTPEAHTQMCKTPSVWIFSHCFTQEASPVSCHPHYCSLVTTAKSWEAFSFYSITAYPHVSISAVEGLYHNHMKQCDCSVVYDMCTGKIRGNTVCWTAMCQQSEINSEIKVKHQGNTLQSRQCREMTCYERIQETFLLLFTSSQQSMSPSSRPVTPSQGYL